MFEKIKKRDGREVAFDPSKITEAIFKAAKAVGGEDRQKALELTLAVMKVLGEKYESDVFSVEDVQDIVEKVLIEQGHARTAKAYILYRAQRTRYREGKSELMDVVEEILKETSRENANVGNSPSAKMLQIASAASKQYYLDRLIPPEFSKAHRQGDIHIHDLDFYGKTLNCIQIPLSTLLQEGFNNGHGYIRPPKRPASATALAAIILQSSQNDMFGGQSFPFFDRDLAPFVANASDEETYQAMEALVYNLNSMHSLSGKERIWVVDKIQQKLLCVSMAEFDDIFEENRYQAFSLNYDSGKIELQDITASIKHRNVNKLFMIKLKSGQKVTVTDNHSVMTFGEKGDLEVRNVYDLDFGLVPRILEFNREDHVFDLSGYPQSRKYHMEEVMLTPALAKLMGYYVAEGSVDGSSISLALFDDDLETDVARIVTEICPEFSLTVHRDREGRKRDIRLNTGKRFAEFIGDVCGRGAINKRVPLAIVKAPLEIVRAFLDGYLSGDGTVGQNRITATTVSKNLRDGLVLLFARLSIPVSCREAEPVTNFASARTRYLISAGGAYLKDIMISGSKMDKLASQTVTMEQTRYDYEFLRPLIKEVYGIYASNSYHYRVSPGYLQEVLDDLKSRVLNDQEEALIDKLRSNIFWLDCFRQVIADIKTSERFHLQRVISAGELPRFSKYLPQFCLYEEYLSRLYLPQVVDETTCSRISNDCKSPGLIQAWAGKVHSQNNKMKNLIRVIERVLNCYCIQVKDKAEADWEDYVYDISVRNNENFMTAEGVFVHNSRAGAQVPFSSLNLGTDTSEGGRRVAKNLLLAYDAGLGRGENPIFPNIIFRVQEGVNLRPEDPNHDLFLLAMKVAAKRMNPTFSFMDSSFNKQYGNEVAYMGCRTRVIANVHGPAVTERRGNLAFTTINLPRLALKAKGSLGEFYRLLESTMWLAVEQLHHRYRVQAELKVKDMPFVMGQHLYMGSENLGLCDPIEEAIKHGTLSVGFIGLAETLVCLTGKHHGESDDSQAIGISIVQFMRQLVDKAVEQYNLNYTFIATPAEGLSGRFLGMDRESFGLIPGVTDREYYTNSFHIPVGCDISLFQKISKEGPYHKYTNAGHISYVEFPAPPVHNAEAVQTIIQHMKDCDMGYAGINFPIDFCEGCGFLGVIDENNCPQCGGSEIRRVRRITGYLSTVDRFNDAKVAELRDRKPHRLS